MPDPSLPLLTVFGGPLSGASAALVPGDNLIGSDPRCALVLPLPGVAAFQVRIHIDANGVAIDDPQRAGGVFLNEQPLATAAYLRDGDVVWLGLPGAAGSIPLRYQAPTATAPPQPEMEQFLFEDGGLVSAGLPAPEVEPEATPMAIAPGPASPPDDPGQDVEPFYVEESAATALPGPPASSTDDDLFLVDEGSVPAPPPPTPPPAVPTPAVAPKPAPTPVSRPTPPSPLPPPAPAPPAQAVGAPPPAKTVAPPPPARPPVASEAAKPSVARPPAARPAGAPPLTAVGAPAARPSARRPITESSVSSRPRIEARPPRARRGGPPIAVIAGIAAAALLIASGAGFLFFRSRSPVLESASPRRVSPGETLTLRGSRFGPDAASNLVRIGQVTARIRKASTGEIEVEVPDLTLRAGQETNLPVTVEVAGRSTKPKDVAFYPSPRIQNLLPDVALPGDEIVIQGHGWGSTPRVRFGDLEAEILAPMPDSVRVRVPAIEGDPGTTLNVTVTEGSDVSNPWTFVVGRLPLVARIDPSPAAPGDVVTIDGRGFGPSLADNLVRIGGLHALLLSASATELKVVIPFVASEGSAPVEVRSRLRETVGEASLALKPSVDPLELRFVAEPLDDVEGHDHAVVGTEVGPAFVFSASGGRSAADRAVEAAARLNAAVVLVKASREADFEARDLDTAPVVGLVGKPEAVLNVTDEDAAAYNEDWTKLGGRGGAVTRGRLARWWGAVARDLVLLLVRSEKPHFTADLAGEGRVLQDVFQASRRATNFGTPRKVVLEMKPPQKDALRLIGLRVPASVTGPAPVPTPAQAPSGAQDALKLDGTWYGSETDRSPKAVSVTFRGRTGSYSLAAGMTIPLNSVDPGPKGVKFALQLRGSPRYYDGRWDGRKITGTISSDLSGRGDLGRFELVRER